MIAWDNQMTTLTRQMHGITGTLRTGASTGVRNYATFVRLYSVKKAQMIDVNLWDVSDILSKRQSPLIAAVPEVFQFTIGRGNLERAVAAVHGIVDVKRGMTWEQQYRFVVVFKHEIAKTLRNEFKMANADLRRLEFTA